MLAKTTDGKLPRRIGPNEPCPCGSGKKFKKCCGTGEPPKKGRLGDTLDQILEPRVAPGKPGRPAGTGSYEWTPEMDKALRELCVGEVSADRLGSARYGRGGTPPPGGWLAYAKKVMAKRLMDLCPRESKPRKDSLRRAVERHMVFLGLSTGNPRKKAEPNPAECIKPKEVSSGAWTPHEIGALLGTIGGDLIKETLVERTHHSVKACYAKLYRLGHTVNELRNGAFTVDELAEMFQVSPRRVRTWKEKGWLKTTRRRATDKDLMAFIKEHHELIAFDALDLCVRNFLLDLGYPAKEASSFKANVKAIMESVAGRKKRCDAQTSGTSDSGRSKEGALKWDKYQGASSPKEPKKKPRKNRARTNKAPTENQPSTTIEGGGCLIFGTSMNGSARSSSSSGLLSSHGFAPPNTDAAYYGGAERID